MEIATVTRMIEAGIPDSQALVTGDGCNLEARVVSPAFAGCAPLQRQRMVMATVKEQLASGEIHALALKTFTPEEWDARQG